MMLGGVITDMRDVLILVFFFGFSIFVHELGHFWVALKLGFVVDTFAIGFGPAIWKKKVKGVLLRVNWLPLGGYVALPQLDPTGMEHVQGKQRDGKDGKKEIEIVDSDLPDIAPWKKILVSVSGALGNVLFAIVLAYVIYFSPSAITSESGPVAVSVDPESSAYELGMRSGDRIVAVNGKGVDSWYKIKIEALLGIGADSRTVVTVQGDGGKKDFEIDVTGTDSGMIELDGLDEMPLCVFDEVFPGGSGAAAGLQAGDAVRELDGVKVRDWNHFRDMVGECGGREIELVIDRNGSETRVALTPAYDEKYGRVMIGVSPVMQNVFPWMYYKKPFEQVSSDASLLFRVLKALVTPREARQAAKSVGGPVFILFALWAAIKISVLNAVGFLRMLNINLAIINLLPIPVLDGGHIIFSLWEWVTRRKLPPKLVAALVNVFVVLLVGLFALLIYRDAFVTIPKAFKLKKEYQETVDQYDLPEK